MLYKTDMPLRVLQEALEKQSSEVDVCPMTTMLRSNMVKRCSDTIDYYWHDLNGITGLTSEEVLILVNPDTFVKWKRNNV